MCLVLSTAAAVAPPTARADEIFLQCTFSVQRPFRYDAGGNQFVATRMDIKNCKTNLPNAPLTVTIDIQVGYGDQQSGATDISRHEYSAPLEVQNGGSYSVQVPNNGDLIPLKPGSFMASGSAASTVSGFVDPRFIETAISTWGVNWGTLPKMP